MMKKVIIMLLIAIPLYLSLSSCSKKDNELVSAKTFVIVPGAWQAPYAWQNVKAELESKGEKVIVVELPGHGADQTDPQTISLDVYSNKVISAINGINGKVILVGHSLGGMVISEVAEKIPAKIEKLIYIAAFLPANGQALRDLANTDAASLLGPSIIPADNGLTLGLLTNNIIDIFIQDGTTAEQNLVLNNYRPEPSIPFTNPVTLTAANYGSVPKYYIHTLQDHAVSMDLQNRMVAAAGITSVYHLNTSHSPFLSKPDSVTALLFNISK